MSDTDFIVPEVEDEVVAKAIKIDTTKTYDKKGRLHRHARSKSHQKHIKKGKGGHETKWPVMDDVMRALGFSTI